MKKRNSEILKASQAFTFILQFSINMIVPIAACMALGYWLDQLVGTNFLAIIGFFFGAIAGFTSIFRLSKSFTRKDKTSIDYPVVDAKDGNNDEKNI